MTFIFANAGIPIIQVTFPFMLFLILPIIAIECWGGKNFVQKETDERKWIGVGVANIVSTFIGWPIAWIALVFLQYKTTGFPDVENITSPLEFILSLTAQALFQIPYHGQLYWTLPVAMCMLLIPFFFVSVYVERVILKWIWKKENRFLVNRFSWMAHLYSYGFLLLVVFVFSVWYLIKAQRTLM